MTRRRTGGDEGNQKGEPGLESVKGKQLATSEQPNYTKEQGEMENMGD